MSLSSNVVLSNSTMLQLARFVSRWNHNSIDAGLNFLLDLAEAPPVESSQVNEHESIPGLETISQFDKFSEKAEISDYYESLNVLLDVYYYAKRRKTFEHENSIAREQHEAIEVPNGSYQSNNLFDEEMKHTESDVVSSKQGQKRKANPYVFANGKEKRPSTAESISNYGTGGPGLENSTVRVWRQHIFHLYQAKKHSTIKRKILPFRGQPMPYPETAPNESEAADYFWKLIGEENLMALCEILMQDSESKLWHPMENMSQDPVGISRYIIANVFQMAALVAQSLSKTLLAVPRLTLEQSQILLFLFQSLAEKADKIAHWVEQTISQAPKVPIAEYVTITEQLLAFLPPPLVKSSSADQRSSTSKSRDAFSSQSLERSCDAFYGIALIDSNEYVHSYKTYDPENVFDSVHQVMLDTIQTFLPLQHDHKVCFDAVTVPLESLLINAHLAGYHVLAQLKRVYSFLWINLRMAPVPTKSCAYASVTVRRQDPETGEKTDFDLYLTKWKVPKKPTSVCSNYASVLPILEDQDGTPTPAAFDEFMRFSKATIFGLIKKMVDSLNKCRTCEQLDGVGAQQLIFCLLLLANNGWSLYNQHRQHHQQPTMNFRNFLLAAAAKYT